MIGMAGSGGGKNDPDFSEVSMSLSKTWTTQALTTPVEVFKFNTGSRDISFTFSATVSYLFYYQIGSGSLVPMPIGLAYTLSPKNNDIHIYLNTQGNVVVETATLTKVIF